MGMVIPLILRFTTPPVAFSVLTVEDNAAVVLLNVPMLPAAMFTLNKSALLLTTVASDVTSDEYPFVAIVADNAVASVVAPLVASAVLMELAKLALLPIAAAISTNVFRLVGAPFTNAEILPSKYEVVAFVASASENVDMLVFNRSYLVCNDVYAPDTDATDKVRVEISVLNNVLKPLFTRFNDATEPNIKLANEVIPLCRFTPSVDNLVLKVPSTVVKGGVASETTSLTDKIALARSIASIDNASLNGGATATNDTDALLNAVDNDAITLPRNDVSMERALTNPSSFVIRDGMAVLLNDATALMRAEVSNDTAVFNEDTVLKVLALTVRLGLVCISDAIFPSVLNRTVTPLNTFAIAVDMLEFRMAGLVVNSDEITEFALTRDATLANTCDEMEVI